MNVSRFGPWLMGCFVVLSSLLATGDPKIIPVGKGSYAEYPPVADAKLQEFLKGPRNVDPALAGKPIPTNKWWTNLLHDKFTGNLWAYPLVFRGDEKGLQIFAPKGWSDKGDDIALAPPLRITGSAEGTKSDIEVIADFEGKSYAPGWVAEGSFGDGPIDGETPVDGFMGKGFASSYHGGDQGTGSLESPEFSIDRKSIHFLIAGGRNPENLHIDLVVDGAAVCTATGENSETFRWKSWDVSKYAGKTGRIRIVDSTKGGWGHILVDEIVQTDQMGDQPLADPRVFTPTSVQAMKWGDWTLTFRLAGAEGHSIDTTIGRGMPMAWTEFNGVQPRVMNIDDGKIFSLKGEPLTLPVVADGVVVEVEGHPFALFAPPGTSFALDGKDLTVAFSTEKHFLVTALLPDVEHAAEFQKYAYARPTDSQFSWAYDPIKATVTTKFDLTLESLDGATHDTLQGWLPHHYRVTKNDLQLSDYSYLTPRGVLKVSQGHSFSMTYPFTGILPALPAPTPEEAKLDHPFDASRMLNYLDKYADDHCNRPSTPKEKRYGEDTYWGGKDLVTYGEFLSMAHEMHDENAASLYKTTLQDAMHDWFTYTPGEEAHYFAYYDNWKGLIGFHPSYGSETFTDNHFHYGYYTYASALLAMYDPGFLHDYGDMAKLVAKQYANWDRSDERFPYLRTFDPWAGHSYAGGSSSGNGNNQESSSEAMQSWGGLFLLGAALEDKDMTAAGAMGYAVEGEAAREYWNNYYGWRDGAAASNFSPNYKHTIVGIVGDSGGAFGTFFEGHPMFIYGIQWLPPSPILAYLGFDPKFGRYQLDNMLSSQQAMSPGFTFSDLKGDWGDVTLGYWLTWDPDGVAAKMDELWDANDEISRQIGISGIVYYLDHAYRSLGVAQPNLHTSIPTSQVFLNPVSHACTAVIYNPSAHAQTATIYRDDAPIGDVQVPANTLFKTAVTLPAK